MALPDISQLPALYSAYKARQEDRDARIEIIDKVVRGDFSVFDPDEEKVEPRSPNLIQVALEDTAEAASLVPTIRVQPAGTSKEAKRVAAQMERIAGSYVDAAEWETKITRLVMDLAAYGLCVLTVRPDFDQKIPLIEWRDPRTFYPEIGYRPGDTSVQSCIFARTVYLTQLPPEWQAKIQDELTVRLGPEVADRNLRVSLVEWWDADEVVVAGIYQHSPGIVASDSASFIPVELGRTPNRIGVTPVVVGSRITLDGEFRGQFDQVVSMMEAHIQLMGMVLDYADQAVYSDVWVRDLIGEMPWGGGGFIELGPNGAIGRVPPAVSSLNIQADLQQLIEGIHIGARWPKTRPGEIDQAIASAKFIEATTGVMNTAIRTYHMILQRVWERALRLAFETDLVHWPGVEKSHVGMLRNHTYTVSYRPERDIDRQHRIRVEYGLGFGRDPAQSAVLHIQYSQNGLISKETVQENIDSLPDVALERKRVDLEQFRGIALAKLLEGVQTGQISSRQFIEIVKGRQAGKDIFELFEEYVVKAEEEAAEQQINTGLGPAVQPGPPVPEGVQPPLPPSPP